MTFYRLSKKLKLFKNISQYSTTDIQFLLCCSVTLWSKVTNSEIFLHTCLIISGLFSICPISGFLCISCCIWGLAIINCLIRSGFESTFWINGFSIIWTIISGLDMSCRCIWLCNSEKLDVFRPRLLRPAKPPRPPLEEKNNWIYISYCKSKQNNIFCKCKILGYIPHFKNNKIQWKLHLCEAVKQSLSLLLK